MLNNSHLKLKLEKIIYKFKDGQIFNEPGIYLYTLLCCLSSDKVQKIF